MRLRQKKKNPQLHSLKNWGLRKALQKLRFWTNTKVNESSTVSATRRIFSADRSNLKENQINAIGRCQNSFKCNLQWTSWKGLFSRKRGKISSLPFLWFCSKGFHKNTIIWFFRPEKGFYICSNFQRPFKYFGNWSHHYRLEVCWKDTLETFGFTLHSYRKKSFWRNMGKKIKRTLLSCWESLYLFFPWPDILLEKHCNGYLDSNDILWTGNGLWLFLLKVLLAFFFFLCHLLIMSLSNSPLLEQLNT